MFDVDKYHIIYRVSYTSGGWCRLSEHSIIYPFQGANVEDHERFFLEAVIRHWK